MSPFLYLLQRLEVFIIVLGENSQLIISNTTLQTNSPTIQWYLIVNNCDGNLTITPQKRQKKIWNAPSNYKLIKNSCSINFNSLYIERKIEDWMGDTLTVQILFNDGSEAYNITDVDFNNLKIDWKDKDLIRYSGTINGILSST
jgi:hypothetical protein